MRGRLALYEQKGEFQLNAVMAEPAGLGALQLAFEQLKKQLADEGLFDAARKKPIPMLPQRIAIVTSPTGAAIRDILNVLGRRFDGLHVQIYPVRVQGRDRVARDRDRDPASLALGAARRRADLPRRRLARGPLAVQRGDRRPRHRRLPDPDDLRRRPRDRLHDLRSRGRPARADAVRRRGDRHPREERDLQSISVDSTASRASQSGCIVDGSPRPLATRRASG